MSINPIHQLAVDIKNFQVKTIGAGDKAEDVVEIKIHAPLGYVDLSDLSRIRKSKNAYLTLETLQGSLNFNQPKKEKTAKSDELPGQIPLTPAGFVLNLVTMPLTQEQIAQAEEKLVSLMGLTDVDELRAKLQELPLAIKETDDKVTAESIKSEFAALGAVVEIAERNPETAEPKAWAVMLQAIPTEESQVADVEKYLKKLTGCKVKEVRDSLQSLPWTLMDKANDVDAADVRIGLSNLGCTVELVPWQEKAPEPPEASSQPAQLWAVILRAVPEDDFGNKAARKAITKITGITALKDELESLPWTIKPSVPAEEASTIKLELMKCGCEVELEMVVQEDAPEAEPEQPENQEIESTVPAAEDQGDEQPLEEVQA